MMSNEADVNRVIMHAKQCYPYTDLTSVLDHNNILCPLVRSIVCAEQLKTVWEQTLGWGCGFLNVAVGCGTQHTEENIFQTKWRGC